MPGGLEKTCHQCISKIASNVSSLNTLGEENPPVLGMLHLFFLPMGFLRVEDCVHRS
ncbi:hypothetical protein G5576_009235 [Homo sapiens]|uniref:Uncharacterized protein n=1 Tax=Homo sapiens TaxID=9606 RepID=A0A2R8Y6I0_HUMAN|nr:hypothetical protein KI723_130365 [Homo sapiens]KAI4063399.1 hypothetical protein G5576_009235 [Homo sapiens]